LRHVPFSAEGLGAGAGPASPKALASSSRGKVKLAVTVDDLLLWEDTPWAPGYSPARVTRDLAKAFASHGIKNVHAFSSTSPLEKDASLISVFDDWASAGGRISNHTHYHANLNWVSDVRYCEDIEKTEEIIGRYDGGPNKYFRYAMDNWGNTQEKYERVSSYLDAGGYTRAPVGVWFYDTEFLVPHLRATIGKDGGALRWLRDRFVDTALNQLRVHAAAARILFDRDPTYIWLIHGTPLASDCIERILDGFVDMGVEFVGLDEAMEDPVNREPVPLITPRFLNHIMKWAEVRSVPIEDCPPAILKELEEVAPLGGFDGPAIMSGVFRKLSDKMGGSFFPKMY
jgi:peptidoglycan/xylan/chitin deacetylase (PgdA/CDA1 family)